MQPWPTAYTFLHRHGKTPMRVIVGTARVGAQLPVLDDRPPGSVIVAAGSIFVVAGDGGMVTLDELQPAGKKRMPAAEFLNGYPIPEGSSFGPEAKP